ncbi:MAG: R2-like ligand-binding oxidase [Acidobacteriota bacterium]
MTTSPTPPRLHTTRRGLDHGTFPMRLWAKAKAHGIWNPQDIDFEQDRRDWEKLNELERDVLLRLSTLFQAGEESVTVDLLPLIGVIASEGRLEEEMYLTSFLWEEAKHVELFDRFLREVTQYQGDLSGYFTPSYSIIFEQELPTALAQLRQDASPEAQARASVTYNMIVEGVLAETGYHAYRHMLERNGILPGMQQAVRHLQRDESRHMAYGVYLLSRLVAEHGDGVWRAIEERLAELLGPAILLIQELFAAYDTLPFGLELEQFTEYAIGQFQKRSQRIEKARGKTLADVSSAQPSAA